MEERTALEEGEDVPWDQQAEQAEKVGVSGGRCLSARLSGWEPQLRFQEPPGKPHPGSEGTPVLQRKRPCLGARVWSFTVQGLAQLSPVGPPLSPAV